MDKRRGRMARLASLVAVGALALGACSSGGGSGGGGGTMNIAINPWVGYEANAAVVGYLSKTQLNYDRQREGPEGGGLLAGLRQTATST